MNPKLRIILILVTVLGVVLGVVFLAYNAAKKGHSGPAAEPTPPPSQDQIAKSAKMGRFSLGEFVATSRDEELHYIKVEVELEYMGDLEKVLEERKGELRDAITTILMKMTVQRAKEDYIDHFLHKDVEKRVNEILGKSTSDSRVTRIFIPVFLIN